MDELSGQGTGNEDRFGLDVPEILIYSFAP
jgi:hypothetical protein